MNNKIKKVLWVILLLIALIPFGLTLYAGIEGAVNGDNGFCADCPDVFGMEAFCGIMLTAFVLLAPIYAVSIAIILLAILKLKGVNSIYTKKIVWSTLLVMLLIILVLPWTSGYFWTVYIIPVIMIAVIRLIMLNVKYRGNEGVETNE